MTTAITIRNLQKYIPTKTLLLKKTAQKVLKAKKVECADLSIVLVGDSQIRLLNKKYLGRSYATDVLAFDLKGPSKKSRKKITAELVISAQTVKRNSKIYGTAPRKELVLCVVHGILHLLGYDDHALKDSKRMRREENRLLKLVYDS